jgi:ElaB/YqjD/DUF883 family membrane-anchored ribosome-binding protein
MKTAHSNSHAAKHANSEMQNLVTDVEELLGRISHLNDTDMAVVRKRVGDSLASARNSLQGGAELVRQRATNAANAVNDYAHDSPWSVAGIAAVAGLALGAIIARR